MLKNFPNSQRILEFEGTIKQYYKHIGIFKQGNHTDKNDIFFSELFNISQLLYGNESAEKIIAQLRKNFIVSTTEHIASITYHETLNTVIDQAIYRMELRENSLVTLACGTVKINNSLRSRSIFINDIPIHYLEKKHNENLALLAPKISEQYATKNFRFFNDTSIDQKTKEHLFHNWTSDYNKVCDFKKLWMQHCVLNNLFWSSITEYCKYTLPNNYFMIPQEVLIKNILLRMIYTNDENWLINCIFDHDIRTRILHCFDGIRACWDIRSRTGTFLFWAIHNKSPVPLFLSGNSLGNENYGITIPLEKNLIANHLENETLFPSTTLSFLYLFFYMNLQIFGGVLQVQYLPDMKARFLKHNPALLNDEDMARISNMPPDLYLNFEEACHSRGGYALTFNKLCDNKINKYINTSFTDISLGCMRWLISISKN